MTDLEKIELAIHHVADEAGSDTPIGYWLRKLAFQIAADEAARKVSAPTKS
jgi:hypothetical protein